MFAKLPPSLLVMSLIVLLTGCSKPKEATPPPVSATPPAQVEAQQSVSAPASVSPAPGPAGQGQVPPVASTPAPIPAPVNGNATATLNELSYQLRMYVAQTRKAPKTFAEFIAYSGVTAPQPPNGMHYAIRSGQVVLEH
jgi:hypothetical protein